MGRARALVLLLTAFGGVYGAQQLLWPRFKVPSDPVEWAIFGLTFVWAMALPPTLFSIAGLLAHGRPRPASTAWADPIGVQVVFRIVSRGDNVGVLRETVANVRRQMGLSPLFPHLIEVVTDKAVDVAGAVCLVVPPGYATPRGSRFKARALHYAVQHSRVPAEAWVMMLDEETQITASVVAGIRDAVAEEEASGEYRIGQGAILYNRHYRKNVFFALADTIRTGDDLGRFFLQHRIGLTLFGLHGSFILARNSVVREVGFDFGPSGSITEDTFWALSQMEAGRRCRWVEGFVQEQSPATVLDFLRQRRRWFWGLVLCVLKAPVKLRYRLSLAVNTLIWGVGWLGILVIALDGITQQGAPMAVRLSGDLTVATFVTYYLLGLWVNLDFASPVRWYQRVTLYVCQVLYIPVFTLLESGSLVYALLRPERGFHVISKAAVEVPAEAAA